MDQTQRLLADLGTLLAVLIVVTRAVFGGLLDEWREHQPRFGGLAADPINQERGGMANEAR